MPLDRGGDVAGKAPLGGLIAVVGRMAGIDGSPAARVDVRVQARDLDGDELLDQGQSGLDGAFRFAIPYARLGGADRKRALVVQAVDGKQHIVDELVLFDPPATVSVELSVPATVGAPRVAQLRERVAAQLGDRRAGDLDGPQLAFVAASSGEDPAAVVRLAQAGALTEQLGIDHDVAFALVHAGLPADPQALLAHADDTILAALDYARRTGTVEAVPPADELAATLRAARVDIGLKPVEQGREVGLGELLAPHLAEATHQQRFVALALEHEGDPTRSGATRQLSSGCQRRQTSGLQDALQVAAMTGGTRR